MLFHYMVKIMQYDHCSLFFVITIKTTKWTAPKKASAFLSLACQHSTGCYEHNKTIIKESMNAVPERHTWQAQAGVEPWKPQASATSLP